MLPDYPELKRELRHDLNLLVQILVDLNAPLMREVQHLGQAEGDRFTYETVDGSVVTKDFKTFSATVRLPTGLSSSETSEEFMTQTAEAAKTMAAQSEGLLFSTLHEITAETGNVLHAEGRPFEPGMIWDMIEKCDVNFDEKTGEPQLPAFVVHPDMMKSIAAKFPEWEADPKLQARRSAVLRQKKEEWRDRESRRKLVG